jgi:hypothetical protein
MRTVYVIYIFFMFIHEKGPCYYCYLGDRIYIFANIPTCIITGTATKVRTLTDSPRTGHSKYVE